MDILGVILAADDWIFTSALPANSQLMLGDDVFVHFDGALREGKGTVGVLIRGSEDSVLGALSGTIGRTSSSAEVMEALAFNHDISLENIYQFQRVNFLSDCTSLVQ